MRRGRDDVRDSFDRDRKNKFDYEDSKRRRRSRSKSRSHSADRKKRDYNERGNVAAGCSENDITINFLAIGRVDLDRGGNNRRYEHENAPVRSKGDPSSTVMIKGLPAHTSHSTVEL